jgi:hypothetical protein
MVEEAKKSSDPALPALRSPVFTELQLARVATDPAFLR